MSHTMSKVIFLRNLLTEYHVNAGIIRSKDEYGKPYFKTDTEANLFKQFYKIGMREYFEKQNTSSVEEAMSEIRISCNMSNMSVSIRDPFSCRYTRNTEKETVYIAKLAQPQMIVSAEGNRFDKTYKKFKELGTEEVQKKVREEIAYCQKKLKEESHKSSVESLIKICILLAIAIYFGITYTAEIAILMIVLMLIPIAIINSTNHNKVNITQ